MRYRVFIPTAGTGSRLGKMTKYFNKSLLCIANRPVLSHLIEKFPRDCEFIIALGFKGKLVKDFLELAYPDRKFFFVNVKPFVGIGSGLGQSLLCSKKYLQQPFVFLSCDTIVEECILPPDHNWMGYASKVNLSSYRSLNIFDNQIKKINEKKKYSGHNLSAYIGLAGIKDYSTFWKAMNKGKNQAVKQGEVYGLRSILKNKSIKAKAFTWHDTGDLKSLNSTRAKYQKKDDPNILDKEKEAIWFVGKRVIKFSQDEKFIKNRVHRSNILKYFVPKVVCQRKNMYSYNKIKGHILSDVISLPLFNKLLKHCKLFWKTENLTKHQNSNFIKTCKYFYKNKTKDRVYQFYKNFDKEDKKENINGEKMPYLSDLLERIDWKNISSGLPGQFHGDLHFENILWNKNKQKFTFLDWRQDFGGNLQVGDVYYDLAKLLHGLIVSHDLILKNKFSVNWSSKKITFKLQRKKTLIKCEKYFEKWCVVNGFDLSKLRIITAIIFLNIASLHHYPYSLLLYALGKKMLKKELNK